MRALGIELDVPSFPSPRAMVRWGAFKREVTLQKPVRVVRREEFDASLVAQARAAGAEVREGAALAGFEVDAGARQVRLRAGGRDEQARVLVGADGAGSQVRKRLVGHRAATAPLPLRLFRAELRAPGAVHEAMLYDFTPMVDGLRGYLWIFPVPGGLLNVGLMHYPDPASPRSGAELEALLAARLDEHGLTLAGAARGWPAWGYHPRTRVAAPHLLTVGDAAGIDALTGEGIAVAMEQGLVAARAIAAALGSGDFRFAGYRRALRRAAVGRELAIDRWLARLLYRGRGHRRWLALVLHDPRVLELYAARVAGTLVLADRKRELVAALLRHLWRGGSRRRALEADAAAPLSIERRLLASGTGDPTP
jgi:flavin-dependent dehydrogenase